MNKNKKIKSRFIFISDDRYYSIKGEINIIKDKVFYKVSGANNLFYLNEEKKKILSQSYFDSLQKIKDIDNSFYQCVSIYIKELDNNKDNNLIKFYYDDKIKSSIHISLEPWILENLYLELENKEKEFNNQVNSLQNQDKVGLIKPNISSIIGESLMSVLLNKGGKNDKNNN